jgi:hypothetical protein
VGYRNYMGDRRSPARPFISAQYSFISLWDSIYAKRGFGWAANPWVEVVEFEREEAK